MTSASSPSRPASCSAKAPPPVTIPTRWIRSGPASKTSGSRPVSLGQARAQLGDRDRLGAPADRADGRPFASPNGRRVGLEAEPLAQQGVVADLGVGVERQVVGGEGGVGAEQRPQPGGHRRRSGPRGCSPQSSPWWASTSSAPAPDGALQRLQVGADAGRDLRDLARAGDLEAVRPVVLERAPTSSSSSQKAMISSRAGHRRADYDLRDEPTPRHDLAAAAGSFIESLRRPTSTRWGRSSATSTPSSSTRSSARSEEIEQRGLERWAERDRDSGRGGVPHAGHRPRGPLLQGAGGVSEPSVAAPAPADRGRDPRRRSPLIGIGDDRLRSSLDEGDTTRSRSTAPARCRKLRRRDPPARGPPGRGRRPGHRRGLQRPPVHRLRRLAARCDRAPDRGRGPRRRGEAGVPPLVDDRARPPASRPTARSPPGCRRSSGSSSSSSSTTRMRRRAGGSPRSSWTRSPRACST